MSRPSTADPPVKIITREMVGQVVHCVKAARRPWGELEAVGSRPATAARPKVDQNEGTARASFRTRATGETRV